MPKASQYSYENYTQWQVDWMNIFAATRQEYNYKIGEEQYVNAQNKNRINQLKNDLADEKIKYTLLEEKMKIRNQAIKEKFRDWKAAADVKIKKLKSKSSEKNQTILELRETLQQLQNQLSSQNTTQSNDDISRNNDSTTKLQELVSPEESDMNDTNQEFESSSSAFLPGSTINNDNSTLPVELSDDVFQRIEESRVTETRQDSVSYAFIFSSEYISVFHPYASTEQQGRCRVFYQCANCDYSTCKKSSYDDHAESCGNEPNKSAMCPICNKNYTYRGLRNHLNHYASGEHKSRGEHAKFTPQDHRDFLNILTANRNQKN